MPGRKWKAPRLFFPGLWLEAVLRELFYKPPKTVRRQELATALAGVNIEIRPQGDYVTLYFDGTKSEKIFRWEAEPELEDLQLNTVIAFLGKIQARVPQLAPHRIPERRGPVNAPA